MGSDSYVTERRSLTAEGVFSEGCEERKISEKEGVFSQGTILSASPTFPVREKGRPVQDEEKIYRDQRKRGQTAVPAEPSRHLFRPSQRKKKPTEG